jgi:hypothetical protein
MRAIGSLAAISMLLGAAFSQAGDDLGLPRRVTPAQTQTRGDEPRAPQSAKGAQKKAPLPKEPTSQALSARGPVPILFPQVPFPLPAPPVVDPRTGAWQQIYGAAPPEGWVMTCGAHGSCPARHRNLCEKLALLFSGWPSSHVPCPGPGGFRVGEWDGRGEPTVH